MNSSGWYGSLPSSISARAFVSHEHFDQSGTGSRLADADLRLANERNCNSGLVFSDCNLPAVYIPKSTLIVFGI